jgi:DNA-binding GntR family transcriptional regulator
MSKLLPLAPRRALHEEAFAAIREFILAGGLRADTFVSANQIARELGVSVTPVKAALERLEASGLVQVLPQRGVRLAAFGADDIRDIYDLREGLEALALDLAPRPFPAEPLARMAAIVEECEAYVRAEDRRRYTQADIRFHEILVAASGNRRLVATFSALQSQIQLVRLRAIVLPGRPLKSHVEHRAIVEALGRDPDAARALLRAHIASVKEDVLRAAAGA